MLTEREDDWFGNQLPNTGASVQYSMEDAHNFLARAEREFEKDEVFHLLKWVRMACAQNGVALNDFLGRENTTEGRLKEIERIGYKWFAKTFLDYLRSWEEIVKKLDKDVGVSFYIDCIRMALRHGNWTLDDIDSTEEELSEYKDRGKAKDEASDLLEEMLKRKMTDGKFKNPDSVRRFRALLLEAVCRLDQIVIPKREVVTEEELASLE
jgi:hypothetical protein